MSIFRQPILAENDGSEVLKLENGKTIQLPKRMIWKADSLPANRWLLFSYNWLTNLFGFPFVRMETRFLAHAVFSEGIFEGVGFHVGKKYYAPTPNSTIRMDIQALYNNNQLSPDNDLLYITVIENHITSYELVKQ